MIRRRVLLCGALAALVLGLVSSGCGGGGVGGREITVEGPVKIERVFEQGDIMKYKFKANSQSGVKLTAYERSIATQAELKTTNTVTSVTDEQVDLSMRFDAAVGSVTMSDRMNPDKTVSALRGKQLDFELSPTGKVRTWTGLSGEEALEAGVGQMAMLLYDIFPQLPDEAITIGSTWTEDYEIPDITASVERDFIGETVYTLLGFKEKYEIRCAEIHRLTTFEFEGRAEQDEEIWLMSGAGTIEGTIVVALDDGKVVFSTSEAIMTLTGEGASVAGAAASGTVEMGIKTRLVIELL